MFKVLSVPLVLLFLWTYGRFLRALLYEKSKENRAARTSAMIRWTALAGVLCFVLSWVCFKWSVEVEPTGTIWVVVYSVVAFVLGFPWTYVVFISFDYLSSAERSFSVFGLVSLCVALNAGAVAYAFARQHR